MTKLLFSKNLLFFILLGIVTLISSCVDQDFDLPPAPELDPAFSNVITITELLNDYYKAGEYTQITDSVAISGVVIADDESGNYFKELVIQDETGGIEVQLNATGLFNDYPVGRRIFVNCQDLWIGDFAGSFQLGGSYDEANDRLNRIDEVLIKQHIARGEIVNDFQPKVTTIDELTTADINTLVQLETIQFAISEIGETFADFPNRNTIFAVNRTLEDCAGNDIILRTSSFADFAEETIADGNGTITAVFSVFNDTPQLFIRDLTDIEFNSARCQKGGGTGTEDLASIESIRDLFTGSETTAPADTKIQGIVISDIDNGNIVNQNLVIQEPDGQGIVLRFTEPHNYKLGDELEVVVSDQELSEFNGLLQINNLELGDASILSRDNEIIPQTLTIAEILSDFENLESTLVQIEAAKILGNSTYGGSSEVEDASGRIDLFVRNDATFGNTPIERAEVTVTAIVSQFNDPQINIRRLSDVVKTGEGGGETGNETLASIASIRDLFIGTETTTPADTKIQGVVISDTDNGNITGRNLVIQEPNGKGIVLRFRDIHSYQLGDELEVIISSKELSEFNGLLQINNLELSDANVLSSNNQITPQTLTISDILMDFENLESTLVKIERATITGNGTYGGASTVADETGMIDMFTRNDATFSGAMIESEEVTVTAIVSSFNSPQINIRNLNDIVKTGEGGGETGGEGALNIDFQNQEDFEDIALNGWQNISLKGEGTRKWIARSFQDNVFAQASAFQDDNPEIDTWLISPALDLMEVSTLSFESATAFWVHDGLTVLFSTDFDGTNAEAATWEVLEVPLAGQNNANYEWVASGDVILPTGQTGYVAFRHVGNSAANTTTYRLDNIEIR